MGRFIRLALCAVMAISAARAGELSPDRYAFMEDMTRHCAELAAMSECFADVRSFPNASRAHADFLKAIEMAGPSADQVDRLDRYYQWSMVGIRSRELCTAAEVSAAPAAKDWADRLDMALKAGCRP